MTIYADSGRGVHPSVRPETSRFWPFDELLSTDDGVDLMGSGDAFTDLGGNPVPFVVDSLIGGKARRFGGSNTILQAPGDAAVESDLKADEVTIGLWIRMIVDTTDGDTLITYGGATGSAVLAENILFKVNVNADRELVVSWEAGAITQTYTFDLYVVPLYKWTYLVFRKRVGTVPAKQAVDLFVNGFLIETSTDLDPPTDGSNGFWTLGANNVGGLIVVQEMPVDIASVNFCNEALTPEQIVDDARRAFLLPLQSRIDARALIEDQSASMIDVTDLNGLGIDFLDGFSVSDGGDQPVKTATVDLLREQENLSLAYLKTDTRINLTDIADPSAYVPFLDANRAIWLEAARLPLFILAESSDYVRIFQGRIDEVDWGGEKVSLSCRDDGGILVDTFIEEERPYGPGATATLEAVLQTILDDNDNSAVADSYDPIALYSPAPSLWILNLRDPPDPLPDSQILLQRREPVMTAIRTLVGQIGFEIRYRYDLGTAAWRLTLYEPDRLRQDVDFSFSPEDILSIQQAKISATQTRNVVRVSYPSSETTGPPVPTTPLPAGITNIGQGWINVDGQENRTFAYYSVTNASARAKYGRRFMEVNESSSSQIDTVEEASRMAVAMCLDLSEPELLYNVTMPLFHEIEIQDVATFLTNRIMHTGDQKRLAAHAVSHTFGDVCTTSIQTRGKPSVGFNRWMVLDSRPGMGKPPTINPFNTLQDMTIGQLVPYITGILDRTSYFVGGKYLQIRNNDFSRWTRGLENPPDAWTPTIAPDFAPNSTTQLSGGYSIDIIDAGLGAGEILNALVPIEADGNTPYSFEVVWRRDIVNAKTIEMTLDFLEADRTTTASTTVLAPGGAGLNFPAVSTQANVWFTSRVDGVTPPATTRFLQIRLGITSGLSPAIIVTCDKVTAYRSTKAFLVRHDNSVGWLASATAAGDPAKNISFSDATTGGTYDRGNNLIVDTVGVTPVDGCHFLVRDPGTYEISASCWFLRNAAVAGTLEVELQAVLNGGYEHFTSADPSDRVSGTIFQAVRTTIEISGGVGQTPATLSVIRDLDAGDRVSMDWKCISGAGSYTAHDGPVSSPPYDTPSYFQMRLKLLD